MGNIELVKTGPGGKNLTHSSNKWRNFSEVCEAKDFSSDPQSNLIPQSIKYAPLNIPEELNLGTWTLIHVIC